MRASGCLWFLSDRRMGLFEVKSSGLTSTTVSGLFDLMVSFFLHICPTSMGERVVRLCGAPCTELRLLTLG
ncbi:unnamed protein product [Callosobruchus maculatus]|uniref:Uncharacterized protein n=1 Tax=Callosobruchus maculatus TaxID=64391 RepID=A0A653CJU1_CALMS|nr:unnamed protein product [Callosobruchus maculatus]